MLTHDQMAASAADAVAVLAEVTGADTNRPTPCRDWDVAALSNHLRQVLAALGLAARDRVVPADHWTTAVATTDAQAADAWTDPAAWQGTVEMGDTAMPAQMIAAMLTTDLVLHGWDLARALGRRFPEAPAAAGAAYDFVGQLAVQGRQMGLFGQPVEVAADAGPLDRALGLSGRDPAWRAPNG